MRTQVQYRLIEDVSDSRGWRIGRGRVTPIRDYQADIRSSGYILLTCGAVYKPTLPFNHCCEEPLEYVQRNHSDARFVIEVVKRISET